jgi:hypothetical protein
MFYMNMPGIQFIPSNGTEGDLFLQDWCARCDSDKELNGTVFAEGRESTTEDFCPIVANSFRGEAVEWRELPYGERLCTAFVPMRSFSN